MYYAPTLFWVNQRLRVIYIGSLSTIFLLCTEKHMAFFSSCIPGDRGNVHQVLTLGSTCVLPGCMKQSRIDAPSDSAR